MLFPFELLFCDAKTNNLTTSQNTPIKSQLSDTVFTSYNFFKIKRPVSYLEDLTKNEDLVIQRADKGNNVITNKNDYKIKTKNVHQFYQTWET